MITANGYRLRKHDKWNWVVEKTAIGAKGTKMENKETILQRRYFGKLDVAVNGLLEVAILDNDAALDLESIKTTIKEAANEIIAGVKDLAARLKKVEAGVASPETIKDAIAVHEPAKKEKLSE